MESICVENLCFSYGSAEVLKNISFQAAYGEFVSVLGPNGVGKSTLFRCMLGLLSPASGCTRIAGVDIAKLRAEELAQKIAYIPQTHAPVFSFTVLDMVLMGTTAQMGRLSTPREPQKRLALEALEYLGIAHLKDRSYRSISGGEQQLVRLARALAQKARILVMDEPSASLDFGNRLRVMQTARKLTQEGYTILQSTHDPDQAYFYSDKILALYAGEVAAWGTPREILDETLLSRLYGVDVEVYRLRGDQIRVCVPAQEKSEI